MEKDNNQQLIERYFEGELNDMEKAAFDQQLKADSAFADAFQMEKDLMDGIESFGNQQMKKQLENLHLEEVIKKNEKQILMPDLEEGKVVQMYPRRWWLAAVALLLIGFLARILFFNNSPTPQQLYAIYATHEFDFTEKSGKADLTNQAEKLLKEKKYQAALPLLEKIIEGLPEEDLRFSMAKGIAQLETGDFESALATFDGVASKNSFYKDEVMWYTGLTYLRQGNMDECKIFLQKISENSNYQKGAKRLILQLEK